jgi:hypothetical protein
MDWSELFARGEQYDVTAPDIETRLAELRDDE